MKFFAAALLVLSINAITVKQMEGESDQTAQMKAFGEKLNIEIPEEVLALEDNAAISQALVETATAAGKSEDEISAALGMWVHLHAIFAWFSCNI